MESSKSPKWDLVIRPHKGWFDLKMGEVIRYWDLIFLLAKRDFVTLYKQTILGPLWFVIQPLVNTLIFTIIFGKVAKIPTDGIPPFLFYLSGTVVWGYFSQCLVSTSNTFVSNAGIFGKVYFPRLTVPISAVIISGLHFLIQFSIFAAFYVYFWFQGSDISPSRGVLLLPLVLLQMAVLGFGMGILISSLTTRYRDLTFAMTFGVQIWMYVTPVVYPLSQVPTQYRAVYALNPMVSIVELFRSGLLGVSSLEPLHIVISVLVTCVVFLMGIVVFSRVEKTFMDTV